MSDLAKALTFTVVLSLLGIGLVLLGLGVAIPVGDSLVEIDGGWQQATALAVGLLCAGGAFYLEILRRDDGKTKKEPVVQAARGDKGISLIRTYDALVEALKEMVRDANETLAIVGSRSRDVDYLAEIENALEKKPGLRHHRVLCGQPRWPELKAHLQRVIDLRNPLGTGGHRTLFLGLLEDFETEPEHSICATEKKVIIVLPSRSAVEVYDTALELTNKEDVQAYIHFVAELYGRSRRIETKEAINSLVPLHE